MHETCETAFSILFMNYLQKVKDFGYDVFKMVVSSFFRCSLVVVVKITSEEVIVDLVIFLV